MRVFESKTGKWIFLGLILWMLPEILHASATTTSTDQAKIIQFNLTILKTPTNPLDTRKMSASLLMDLSASGTQEPLLKILNDPTDSQAQLSVIEAIADRDEPPQAFIKPLMNILMSGDPELQAAAVNALGRYRDQKLREELIRIGSDPKRLLAQRLPAIYTLGKLRTKETVESLIGILETAPQSKNDQTEIETACAKSLYDLTHVDLGVNLEAWKTWWEQNKNESTNQWLENQLDLVTTENRDLKKRLEQTEKSLIDTLGKLYQVSSTNESDRIKLLQSYLSGILPAERRAGLEILMALITPKQPVPSELKSAIRDLIDDPDPGVRIACAKTLALIGDRQAVDAMFKQMDVESSPLVKQAMLLAIGQLGDKGILQKLIQQLNSPLEPISSGAGKAIAKIFQTQKNLSPELKDQTIEALLKRYKQTSSDQTTLRQDLLATMTDENVADKRFLQVFQNDLSSPDAEIRRFAAKGIASLHDENLTKLLIAQLNDNEPAVRAEIASGIASMSSEPSLVDTLLARISSNVEKDSQVRLATWNAILSMIKRWPIDQQLDWSLKLTTRNDAVGSELLNDLVNVLYDQITEQSAAWTADRKVTVMVNFGSFLLKLSRPQDALKFFRQAVSTSRQLAQDESTSLADQLLNLLLTSTRSEKVLSQYINNLNGLLDQTQFQIIIDRFVKWGELPGNQAVAISICSLLSQDLIKNLSSESIAQLERFKTKISTDTQPAAKATP
jgi:bilin biosynthesis protein